MNYKNQLCNALYITSAFGLFLSFSTQTLAVENKRLAFSEKVGVEVLAYGDNWCSDTAKIELKVQSDEFFSSGQAATFMKKIAKAVLPAECPEAKNVIVLGSSASSDKTLFNGFASKTDSWQLVSNKTVVVETKTVQDKVQTITTDVEDKIVKVGSSENKTAVEQPIENNTDKAVVNSMLENTLATMTDKVDENVKLTNEANVSKDLTEAGEMPKAPANKEEPKDSNFAVGDYRPRIGSTQFTNPEKDAVSVLTLDRCKIYDLQHRLSTDWIAFPKDGFKCVDGSLNGHGVVEFKNIDAISQGNVEGDLLNGHFFKNIPEGWQPQSFEKVGNRYSSHNAAIFHIESNAALKTHFIGVMTASGAQFDRHVIYAVTDHEILLDPSLTDKVVEELVKLQQKQGYKRWDLRTVYIYESLADYNQGIIGIKADRPYVQGASYKVTNYVVDREQKRLAEIERKKEALVLRQIMLERQMETEYLAYQQLSSDELKKKVVGSYLSSFTSSDYLKAAEGALEIRKHRSTWMLHINDVDGSDLEIDFPVAMEAQSTDIQEKGWYLVDANLSGVIGKTDNSGYIQPKLTNITVNQHCKQDKCNEYTDPLTVIRTLNQMPEWTPSNKKD